MSISIISSTLEKSIKRNKQVYPNLINLKKDSVQCKRKRISEDRTLPQFKMENDLPAICSKSKNKNRSEIRCPITIREE